MIDAVFSGKGRMELWFRASPFVRCFLSNGPMTPWLIPLVKVLFLCPLTVITHFGMPFATPFQFQKLFKEVGRCAQKCLETASRYGEVRWFCLIVQSTILCTSFRQGPSWWRRDHSHTPIKSFVLEFKVGGYLTGKFLTFLAG
jgi:hypothetical protein